MDRPDRVPEDSLQRAIIPLISLLLFLFIVALFCFTVFFCPFPVFASLSSLSLLPVAIAKLYLAFIPLALA
jgi:hypothetical protein